MPFWWRRRRRRWIPRRRYRFYKRRNRRRRPLHRRFRTKKRRYRRRRRRKHKVRRKRKAIPIIQWQPDSIRNCKIKGIQTFILGAHGKQFVCFTNVASATTPPRAPGGGGFCCLQYSLGMLYKEYKFRRNIWTSTNINKDLCRFVKAKITFYRHPDFDFIINFDRQPPFNINEWTYPMCHPVNLLLGKHKILLLSKKSKPNGRLKKTITIRPPKQMINKWFFQEEFHKAPLFQIRAAVCSLQYPNIGCCNKNQIVTFAYLNTGFYQQGNWAHRPNETQRYEPYPGIVKYKYWDVPVDQIPTTEQPEFTRKHSIEVDPHTYSESVSYDKGFFQPKVMQAKAVTRDSTPGSAIANIPVGIARYNPNKDTGTGNTVWLHSNLTNSYSKPTTDATLIIKGLPLWMILFGWPSYVQYVKGLKDFFLSYTICFESPAIEYMSQIGASTTVIPIDYTFIQGKAPYDSQITYQDKRYWYPDIYNQLEVINSIVCSGPYIPKLDNQTLSTWELHGHYSFFFKWGGPEITDQPVVDPSAQPTYDPFDKQLQTIQIRNPAKQKHSTLFHPWDIRRGIIKEKAIKRMSENLSIDTTFEADESPTKKPRYTGPCLTIAEQENQEEIACLQELLQENTFQEIQETQDPEVLFQLIQQQHQQQQQIKLNLIKLISELKTKQQLLQLQTGFLS
nr:MAG: ORF1 [Torque teno midi virus]